MSVMWMASETDQIQVIEADVSGHEWTSAYYIQNGVKPDRALAFKGRAIVNGVILSTKGLSRQRGEGHPELLKVPLG
jgi:hypothetical protein